MTSMKRPTAFADNQRRRFLGHIYLGHTNLAFRNRLDLSQIEGYQSKMLIAVPALLDRIRDLMPIHGWNADHLARHRGFLRRACAGDLQVSQEIYSDDDGHQCVDLRVSDKDELRCDLTAVRRESGLTLEYRKWWSGEWQKKIYKLFLIPPDLN